MSLTIRKADLASLGMDLPQEATFEMPSGGDVAYQLDAGTSYPLYLQMDSTWLSLKDLKALRKFLKAAEAQLKAAAA